MAYFRGSRRYILSIFGQMLFFCVFKTSRWVIHGEEHLLIPLRENYPILICAWHGRLAYVVNYMKHINMKPWAVASLHDDGDIISRILARWGFRMIRGSSNRGGREVIKQMIQAFNSNNRVIALTNDGPKGPAKIAKPGSINLAKQFNASIIAISGNSIGYWQFKSWDKFRIPKPFSTIHIHISPPMVFPESNDDKTDDSNSVTQFINDNQILCDTKVRNDEK
ncbi:MAG: lysophospholipid acyltransferase family protein [Candidatus Marinimicrobia bacterium]|nr:lysophospholipid acyltransferase family protein [Candidatus Neomarinimicrobiota bacterium]MBT3632811.1 lysophospholipid acyltransferase family protein [Candidatus Neomarinimicrobiota bacterium]MBT3681921.1 lysophospholipid acyltransferase family protein [Candidatus Neomarinimicrobiota bacterium]MBT3759050.1 lysophospholipid acyltransferase family protein [Candidatus Neomarinimicrobiota bacterium]MBT3895051.1 lysophospholipid acyltransferase family protein [Candidatus Neomarinimicrobiota bact